MTCIVGFADKGKVYIGGDSAGISGQNIMLRADEKVFYNGEFIFGFTSSFRMGQILRYNFTPPERLGFLTDKEYLHGDFLDVLIKTLISKKYAKIDNNQIEGGTFLMGYRGNLYYVGSDFQIGESLKNYDSVGCGSNFALGALSAIEKDTIPIELKIKLALEAAETFSTGVSRPFKIISI